jgi:hypothetical protein
MIPRDFFPLRLFQMTRALPFALRTLSSHHLSLAHPSHQTISPSQSDHAARSLPQLFYADARLSVRVMVLQLTCSAACEALGHINTKPSSRRTPARWTPVRTKH